MTNHVCHQGLLQLLEPNLLASAQNAPKVKGQSGEETKAWPRIILVGSRLEKRGGEILDLDAIEESKGARITPLTTPSVNDCPDARQLPNNAFDPMMHYAATKHANMLLAQQLSAHYRDLSRSEMPVSRMPGIYVITPGMVHTGLWRNFPTWYRALTYPLRAIGLRSADDAAKGVVFAAASAMETRTSNAGANPDNLNIDSYVYLSDGIPIEPSARARDKDRALRLFSLSELVFSHDCP